jgi:hypothetical protein
MNSHHMCREGVNTSQRAFHRGLGDISEDKDEQLRIPSQAASWSGPLCCVEDPMTSPTNCHDGRSVRSRI